MQKWDSFWIATDHCYLLVESHAKWLQVVEKHGGDVESLLNLKSSDRSLWQPDFGTDPEHTAKPTLREWAKQSQVDLAL